MLRRARHLAPEQENNFTINRQEQLTKVYDNLTGALYGVASGVGFITLIVGGIGIMNIMLVSVRERPGRSACVERWARASGPS